MGFWADAKQGPTLGILRYGVSPTFPAGREHRVNTGATVRPVSGGWLGQCEECGQRSRYPGRDTTAVFIREHLSRNGACGPVHLLDSTGAVVGELAKLPPNRRRVTVVRLCTVKPAWRWRCQVWGCRRTLAEAVESWPSIGAAADAGRRHLGRAHPRE